MRVAALYDVHGNLPALEAVLADVAGEGIELVVSGGDVTWGPQPQECVTLLREAGARFLAGNCERDVLASEEASSRWCLERLDRATRDLVASWPATLELDVGGLGHVLFCHATPRSDREILTRNTPDAAVADVLAGTVADVVVCGHTHVQYDRSIGESPRLVNAGSVGLPYQGEPGAFWAVLDVDVELRRTQYDVERALASLLTSEFTFAGDLFPESMRGEIAAESATAHFEAKRLGA